MAEASKYDIYDIVQRSENMKQMNITDYIGERRMEGLL